MVKGDSPLGMAQKEGPSKTVLRPPDAISRRRAGERMPAESEFAMKSAPDDGTEAPQVTAVYGDGTFSEFSETVPSWEFILTGEKRSWVFHGAIFSRKEEKAKSMGWTLPLLSPQGNGELQMTARIVQKRDPFPGRAIPVGLVLFQKGQESGEGRKRLPRSISTETRRPFVDRHIAVSENIFICFSRHYKRLLVCFSPLG